jgi:hypothetical protein
MIEHIVLLRWKPETTAAQIAAGLTGLRGLKDSIPGIVALDCGADFSGRAQGYTHALVVRFTDRAALDAYGPHPAHATLVETQLLPIIEAIIEFDFELTPEAS